MNRKLAEDVSAASAAYLWNVLPQVMALPPPEAYERLRQVFETAFLAYHDGAAGLFDPSSN